MMAQVVSGCSFRLRIPRSVTTPVLDDEFPMRFLPLLALLVVIGLVLLSLALGISLGLGWVLSRIVPVSLAEGAGLVLLAALFLLLLFRGILTSIPLTTQESSAEVAEEEPELRAIPLTRIAPTPEERTWENWVRYRLAQSIYEAFQVEPRTIGHMRDAEQQELAIRLADAGVALLKRRNAQGRLNITRSQLERYFREIGQQPYDAAILSLATGVMTAEMRLHEETIRHILRERLWMHLADGFPS